MATLQHIGTVELISLPDEQIKAVPAKVDTGADSSAIWATNIRERDGQLTFKLFGKQSPFYTGRHIKTKRYRVVSVRNSFGHSERRYKVYLRLTVAKRTIRASVTLADRAKNRYPILIGRRTLRGKFLVDVKKSSAKAKFEVLMVSTKKTAVTAGFAKNLERYGKKLKLTYTAYEDLVFNLGEPAN